MWWPVDPDWAASAGDGAPPPPPFPLSAVSSASSALSSTAAEWSWHWLDSVLSWGCRAKGNGWHRLAGLGDGQRFQLCPHGAGQRGAVRGSSQWGILFTAAAVGDPVLSAAPPPRSAAGLATATMPTGCFAASSPPRTGAPTRSSPPVGAPHPAPPPPIPPFLAVPRSGPAAHERHLHPPPPCRRATRHVVGLARPASRSAHDARHGVGRHSAAASRQ